MLVIPQNRDVRGALLRSTIFIVISLASAANCCGEGGPNGEKKGLGRYFEDIFNTELPFTNPDSAWDLDIKPKFKDIVDENYIRLPLKARYGFTDTLEGSAGYTPYIANPFRSRSESSYGIVEFGLKNRLDNFLDDSWEMAFGGKVLFPVDNIPFDREAPYVSRDNFTRIQPFAVVSKRLTHDERWSVFVNVSYDWIDRYFLDRRNYLTKPKSLLHLMPGVIFKPGGEWRYSLELGYNTSRLGGGHENEWILRPGIGWFPDDDNPFKPLPGEVDIGLTVDYVIESLPENSERSDVRISVAVNWRLHRNHKSEAH